MKKSFVKPTGIFFTVTLGCPKNLVDSELICGSLLSANWVMTNDPDEANLYVINTCAFLPSAREEVRDEISQAVEWKEQNSNRTIAVGGCLFRHPEFSEFQRLFPEVNVWFGVDDVIRLPDILKGSPPVVDLPNFLYDETMPRLQLTLPHVAYLKLADGCNNHCAYCAIPNLRGALRSRESGSILREAEQLVGNGVKELVLIAQDTTAYGMDRPASGDTLPFLLRGLNEIEGDFVIRLLYTHPANYTDDFITAVAESEKILPYLDMPLQHISDRILREMNRHVDAATIRSLIEKLRNRIPNLTLRTTFITGLPGETEDEFAELETFARDFKFERMGVFPYAPEPGTLAAARDDLIDTTLAVERAVKLNRNQIARMKRMHRKLLGSYQRVLVDYLTGGTAVARGAMDAPEIDNMVLIPRPGKLRPGEFVKVKIINVDNCDVIAQWG